MPPDYVCPKHGAQLIIDEHRAACPKGHEFVVTGSGPRFVESSYAEPFGRQWRRFQLTQLDSHTGTCISEDRLRRCLGWPKTANCRFAEETVFLEAGCGAGRFTEVLLEISGAHITSIDLSEAVVANAANFPESERHRVAQADIRQLPFPPRSFDYVLCLGVVQHTPNPEETIGFLYEQVKPGGWLVFDHYTWGLSTLTRPGQMLRQLFKRLPADRQLPAVEQLVDRLLPWHRRLSRYGRFVSRISPVLSYYHIYPDLRPELQREWAILDTHDTLTDHYKHHRSRRQISDVLHHLGGEAILIAKAGNGIEARMRRPA